MHLYGVSDVERLLRLPRSTIRLLVEAGFVSPTRGPRNAWQFSFRDLVLLRTAQSLVAAKVPARRIAKSVKALRSRLPESMPLSGLSIGAVADQVVVKEGATRWQPDSGQYLLDFDGDPEDGSLKVAERPHAQALRSVPTAAPAPARPTEDWFLQAGTFEDQGQTEQAARAYRQAIAVDSTRVDARINLGRLLHQTGQLAAAERVYREAIALGGEDPILYFNIGVLLEDMRRNADAVVAYEAALALDPTLADCHYNLALLFETLKRPKEAIRHMARYRRLVDNA